MNTDNKYILELLKRYPTLSSCMSSIEKAYEILKTAALNGNKILLCGNGGSSADCEHISGELMKGFLLKRPLKHEDINRFSEYHGGQELSRKLQYGVCAIPLPAMTALSTAYINDVDPFMVYAQLVFAMGKTGDVLMCISTSGNADNVYNAAMTAKVMGLNVIGLTGKSGGKLDGICDACIKVPDTETYKIQELHLPVYHCLCAALEHELFGDYI